MRLHTRTSPLPCPASSNYNALTTNLFRINNLTPNPFSKKYLAPAFAVSR